MNDSAGVNLVTRGKQTRPFFSPARRYLPSRSDDSCFSIDSFIYYLIQSPQNTANSPDYSRHPCARASSILSINPHHRAISTADVLAFRDKAEPKFHQLESQGEARRGAGESRPFGAHVIPRLGWRSYDAGVDADRRITLALLCAGNSIATTQALWGAASPTMTMRTAAA